MTRTAENRIYTVSNASYHPGSQSQVKGSGERGEGTQFIATRSQHCLETATDDKNLLEPEGTLWESFWSPKEALGTGRNFFGALRSAWLGALLSGAERGSSGAQELMRTCILHDVSVKNRMAACCTVLCLHAAPC